MRDNGLPAQEWTHVADLDPWLADEALDALRRAGVAAYATPHAGRAGPYLDVQLPDRPTDRLFVESAAVERAASVLADLDRDAAAQDDGAGPSRDEVTSQVDATFAEIVAHYTREPADAPPDDHGEGRVVAQPQPVLPGVGWDDLLAGTSASTPPPELEDEDEDGYVPPPPAPVPTGTPIRRFAWLAVLAAPVAVVLCLLVSYPLDGWIGLLVVGAFLGGLGTLFATLDDGSPDEDGPDHGAVV